MTATCHRREPKEYPGLLRAETERLVRALGKAGTDLDISTCPGWNSWQLAEHVGGLYRWAEAHIRTGSQSRISGKDLGLEIPKDFESLKQWILDGIDSLAATLDAHDPDEPVWSWGSDRHARFWGRRMLFETVIHRADLELSLGSKVTIEAGTAIDGIDEFLDNLSHAAYFAPDVEKLRGDNRTLNLVSPDASVEWRICLLADRFEWDHDTDRPDATATAVASELLLFVYGRVGTDGVEVAGDASLVELWAINSRI